ncbi:VIT-domain-containing protein [Xylaria sp. CBS 124048]|nr:VIT-domain-containing protein [Xylaria sp. CBS 124048]
MLRPRHPATSSGGLFSPVNHGSCVPLRSMRVHAIIKDVASRTLLSQTFWNNGSRLNDMQYAFPLYDGVSIVSFSITVDNVHIHGVVKDKQQARRDYHQAVSQGVRAGLLEQLNEASDVFITNIGSVPAGAQVVVEIVYIGELRYDTQYNGTRFTIPSSLAPRYGAMPRGLAAASHLGRCDEGIQIVVDFQSPTGCVIQQIQSPTHLLNVTIGRTSDMAVGATYMPNTASATLSVETAVLGNDFVIIAGIMDSDRPKALLETHATIENQRALMATLVPRFNIAPVNGEIVFIVDRSGSMRGSPMHMVIKSMTDLLKSLPVGTLFNICSFGAKYSFLWPRSRAYNDASLAKALEHVNSFRADFGGTVFHRPVRATLSRRFSDMLLDVVMLTDGQAWNQEPLLRLIEEESKDGKCRFFTLGIGSQVSTALIEGIARAGKGFSQFITSGEPMDAKLARLLLGALSPRINDYSLEVRYKERHDDSETMRGDDSEFEIESVKSASEVHTAFPTRSEYATAMRQPISFFDETIDVNAGFDIKTGQARADNDRFHHLPAISSPSILQAPTQIPPLYSFTRATVYLLLDPSTYHLTPEAIILRATCSQGPLALEFEVEDIGKGETIHQLAAKKAVSELESNGGWLSTATNKVDGTPIRNAYEGHWESIVEREAIRLGVRYQIAGKWCSFVAVDNRRHERETVVAAGKTGTDGNGNMPVPASYAQHSQRIQQPMPRGMSAHMQTQVASTGNAAVGSSDTGASIASTGLFGSMEASDNAAPWSVRMYSSTATSDSRTSNGPSGSTPARNAGPPPAQLHDDAYQSDDDDDHGDDDDDNDDNDDDDDDDASECQARGFCALAMSPVARRDIRPREDPILEEHAKIREVIRLQKPDGSWAWRRRLLTVLGVAGYQERRDALAATTLAIKFFENLVSASNDGTYDLNIQKARTWLAQQHMAGSGAYYPAR